MKEDVTGKTAFDRMVKKTQKKASRMLTEASWQDVLDAIRDSDADRLLELAPHFGSLTPLPQSGLSINDRTNQLLALAPGKHPYTGSLIRDLAEALKEA